jgi:sigma-B regulation protein RsbU (phosphoserine phosphatase)
VGGDFYDLFPLPDETGCRDVLHYGLAIADVSGKGIPAALMMAFSQGILHTAAFAQPGPDGVLFHTNQSILQSSHSGLLLTAFYAVLNPCTGGLCYANGGHEPPILYRAATADCQDLNCGQSLLLGARREQPFAAYETQMHPGDLLLLYTDGVTEARSQTGEFFAEERLNTLITQHARDGCAALLNALNQALEEFKEGTPPSDDITLLALRRVV